MARPKPDIHGIQARILKEAERMLVESNGQRLVLSGIARRIGMSQSYLHTFFASKSDLVRALAQQWFAEVESVSAAAVQSSLPPAARLETWVLGTLHLKRKRYDRNPDLFLAYLQLAEGHADIVQAHTDRLRRDLREIVSGFSPSCGTDTAVQLAEDCTLMFRTPQNIVRFRSSATDERAKAVCKFLAAAFSGADRN